MASASDMILVCGEALFDLFGSEQGNGYNFSAQPGGSPFNVAIGLARLNLRAGLCTGISTDFLGTKLMRVLAAEGVDTRQVVRSSAPTTTAFVSLSETGVPEYVFRGETAADRSMDASTLPGVAEATALHFGSYSLVAGSTADLFATLMCDSKNTHFISVDPNVRPTVEPDMARWRARVEHAASCANMLKLSDEDAALLYPGQAIDDLAATLLAHGPALVVITRGERGASAYTATERLDVDGIGTDVIDTVGAGDSFQAALLAGLELRGLLTRDGLENLGREVILSLMQNAIVASAITCSRAGANLPCASEIAAFQTPTPHSA
jgi:fructokinase